MQRSLTRLSSRFLPRCRLFLHPTTRLPSQATRKLTPRTEYYLVGIGRGVDSVLLKIHRSYIRGVNKPGKIPGKSNKSDAIALNKEIANFGKKGKWEDILQLAEKEKNRFNNVNWATAFSQLGRIRKIDRRDARFKSFVKEYAACLENRGLQWAGIREIANAVHAIGKMKLKNPDTKSIVIFISKEENARKIVQGTPQEVANVAWAFATLGVKSPELFAAIERRANSLVAQGNTQDVGNTAWAFATLNVYSPKLFAAIESRGYWLVTNGKTQEIANTAWAFATLNVKAPKLFATIGTRADWLVTNETPQGVANTAWAFATLGVKSPKLFAAIESRANWLVKNGTPQGVANTAWAFATLDINSPKLFAAIESRSDWLVTNGTPQGVANTAWTFATLGVKAPKLFVAIKSRVDWLVTNGTPQNVANTAWAFATLNVKSPKLFAEIESRGDWLVTQGTPQGVANTAWAFATLNVKSPKFFAAIESRSDWLVTSGKTQHVANTIWAASQFHYNSPRLMQEANLRGAWLVEEGNTQEISNSAIAFAKHGFDASTFFTAVTNNVSKLTCDGKSQHIINVCYAMAVLDLGKKHADAFDQLWNAAMDLDTEILQNEELRQLGQVFAFCTTNGLKLQQPSSLLTQKIGAVVQDSTKSKYQQEVATFLGRLGLEYEEEVSPFEGSQIDKSMLSIDFECKSHMLAIEYDGESHFLRELGAGKVTQRENGATKAKRRFLQQTGWIVININYQDWIIAKKNNRQLEFLREKLSQGGIQL